MNAISPAQQRQFENEIYDAVVARVGADKAQVSSDLEDFDAWYDRMLASGHIYERVDIASLPVDQRLAAIQAEEAAEASGLVMVDDVTPFEDPLTEAAAELRATDPAQRFNAYKNARAGILAEPTISFEEET